MAQRRPFLTAVASAILVLATGCGSNGASRRVQRTATSPRTAATTPPAPAPASGPTGAAPLPGEGRPAVSIGDKNYGEQFVLGELYRAALVAQGFTASLNRNIGPTEVTLQALRSHRLDLYPEYVDRFNRDVAGDGRTFPTAGRALAAARRHAARLGFRLLHPTPFSNVTAIAVTPVFASANRLRSIADLTPLGPALTFGGPLQFQTGRPGLESLASAYGLRPVSFKALDVGAQMDALINGSVQAVAVDSSDAQLRVGQYVLLSDPKHVFGWGNVVPVVPRSVLAAEGPVFERTINAVSALLTEPVIRQLNADVETSGQDPGAAARRFLMANGLIPQPHSMP